MSNRAEVKRDGTTNGSKILKIFPQNIGEIGNKEYNDNKEGDSMEFEKYLEKLIHDIEKSEERIHEENKLLEERLNKNIDTYREEMKERDLKYRDEAKEREERIEKKFDQTMLSLKETNNNFESKVQRMEDKLDGTLKWVIGTCAATILGIAALVISVILK